MGKTISLHTILRKCFSKEIFFLFQKMFLFKIRLSKKKKRKGFFQKSFSQKKCFILFLEESEKNSVFKNICFQKMFLPHWIFLHKKKTFSSFSLKSENLSPKKCFYHVGKCFKKEGLFLKKKKNRSKKLLPNNKNVLKKNVFLPC